MWSGADQGAEASQLVGAEPEVPGPLPFVLPQLPQAHLLLGCCAHGHAGLMGSTALQLGSSFMPQPESAGLCSLRTLLLAPCPLLGLTGLFSPFLALAPQFLKKLSDQFEASSAFSSPPSPPHPPQGAVETEPHPCHAQSPWTPNSTQTTCHPHSSTWWQRPSCRAPPPPTQHRD